MKDTGLTKTQATAYFLIIATFTLTLTSCAGLAGAAPAPTPESEDTIAGKTLDGVASAGPAREPAFLLDYDGTTVNTFVIGDPRAVRRVVFIHGWAGSGAEFIDLAERLSADRPDIACFCVDLPGSGSSGKPLGAPYDVPYFRAAIRVIVEAASRYGLPDGRSAADVTLVGHSLGGHFSADYAARDGYGIDRLALVSPAGWPGEVGAMQAWASKNDLTLSLVPKFITEETYVAGHKLMMFFSDSGYSEAAPRYTGRLLATPEGRAALEAITRNALEKDCVDDALDDIAVPVLLAWGRNDPVLPFSYAEKFLSRLPAGARFEPFDRCGHMPHCERAPELAVILSEFIGL